MQPKLEEIITNIQNDSQKATTGEVIMTVQIAPAVRVAIGEYLGLPAGTNMVGKIIGVLRELGFKHVFDTNFGADLTIVEEAAELVNRLKKGGPFPMFTTCCPTWYQYVERMYPEFIPNLSTVKSPQAMLASIVKTYFAEKSGLDYHKIKHYVIAPCLMKKHEALKKDLWVHENEDIPNIDQVITTQELAEIIKSKGIDINTVKESEFDNPLGTSSGAGAIFGTTGGVTEAVFRTAYFYLEGKDLENYDLVEVRNTSLRREGTANLNGHEINIAVVNSLAEMKKILDDFQKTGKCKYEFVEVMACPMGCIGGGGQAVQDHLILEKRREALFTYDKEHEARAAHQNRYIQALYKDYLGDVHGQKAHEILHTRYQDRSNDPAEEFVCKLS
jgi:iron-only hydrogenase group A